MKSLVKNKINIINFFILLAFVLFSIYSLIFSNNLLDYEQIIEVIIQLRLPRYIATLLIGSMLGICGCLMQNVTHNPLVEPHILGVSTTSSLFSIIFLLMNLNIVVGGIVGALIAIILLNYFNYCSILSSTYNYNLIILKGVMLNTICGAAITLILQLAPHEQIPSLLFWLMGDLSYITWINNIYLFVSFILLFVWCLYNKQKLNYLCLDIDKAYSLGVNLRKLHYIIFILVSIITGIITSQVGSISFIALIAPYLAQSILKMKNIKFNIFIQIIYSSILGALLLNIADNISKQIIYPAQLSIGIITAFLGVPIFWKILNVLYKKS